MDDPCLTCQTQVRGRQQAVECDWCHRWQHRKCGTGISQSAYREAVKLGGLSFVCRPCRDSEIAPPTLELSVIEQNPRDTSLEEPPILEISIPVTRNKGDKFTEDTVIDDIHEQVPTENTTWPDVPLDLRIPETQIDEDDDMNMYFEYTVIDDMQMHEIREEIPDILAEWEPSADSTNIERPDEVSSFDLSLGHTVNDSSFDISFDISAHEIEPVLPIEERTMNDVLSETILQDRGTTFTIIESGSQKRSKVLVSSLGFAYGMKVRQTACEQVFRPATALAEEIILDFHRPDNVAGLKKGLLKRSANRARAALRPKEPKTLDFEVDNQFINGDEFLVADVNEDGQRHFLFATSKQLQLLKDARRWYMDGTFKILGEPFKRSGRLMSIHAFIKKGEQMKQVPLLFCLMSRRTKEDYVMVLRSLLAKVGEYSVEGFVLDFETAAWRAIREVFSNIEVKGCAFHWAQAVWRHVQQVGLAETYRNRLGMQKFIRMLLSLQFLPAEHIVPTFEKMAERATTEPTHQLTAYMRRQWIESTVFPVKDWSVYRQLIRTNNDVEGWHHRMNNKAEGALSFYRLVPLLRREAELVTIAVEGGDLQRANHKRYAQLDKALEDCYGKYADGTIKVSMFLERVGELYSVS